MALAAEAFKVATEFVFDAGLASAEVGLLQGKVQGLSNTAESAIATVKSLGINFALQFSGAGGGVLSLLGSAITASDDFKKSQLDLTNIISANMEHLTGTVGSFNDQMMTSKVILNDIAKDAIKFGLPAKQLEGFTKNLAAFLIPKGLAGQNLKSARDISRNLLKSAPILGVNPEFAGGQLIRGIEGQAGINNPVFRRLLNEAPEPFKDAGVSNAKGFNALDAAKRFQILNDALAKFSSNADVLTARANTLSGIFQRVKNLFAGLGSILKPLGDVILPPLVEILNIGIDILQNEGANLVKEFAAFIEPFLRNPKQLILGLMQISELASDVGSAASIASIILLLVHLEQLFVFIGSFKGGAALLTFLASLVARSKILTFIVGNLKTAFAALANFMSGTVFVVITKLLGVFGLLVIGFQAISRAMAIAKFDRVTKFIQESGEIANSVRRIKESFFNIVQPIQDIIEGIAQLLAKTLFNTSISTGFLVGLLNLLANVLEKIALGVNFLLSGLRAVFAFITSGIANLINLVPDFISALSQGDFSTAAEILKNGVGNALGDAGDEFQKSFGRNIATIEGDEETGAVVNNVTNIGKVEIKNDFKEQLEPDRVAFTIKNQLMKAAQNPTQARGRTLPGAFF